jgi:UDP-glucose:(heptosyl)LPS alpha-1,3-glucosyltransferase/heptose I phosphotransferase
MSDVLHIPVSVRSWLKGRTAFSAVMRLQGKAFRDVKGRRTIQVKLGEHSYFVKQHFGVGWIEIVKNLMSFKKPVLGAMTEVSAIQQLVTLGIPPRPLVA